jgi:hypothetical protein
VISGKLGGVATSSTRRRLCVHGQPRPIVSSTARESGRRQPPVQIVGDEDPDMRGSYVTTQRYVTDFAR